ncbi:MAG: PAS domain S-box protein, partial [Acidobacteriota bacterium]|nr:PAS domain S-box protein [Acidobacteriota bacterium]
MQHRATVLVVDDYEDALAATALILERGGYHVAQALSGRQALELAKQLRPDLILLDVILPDISGLEVLRQIRADPAIADSPVILFSARATDPEQQAGGLDAGADGYLTKPVAAAELLARVRAQVRNRELTVALRASEARYRDLVETSHDLIWAVDAEGRITFLNQASRKIYGREPGEMVGRLFFDFVSAEQAGRDAAVFAEALQSGRDTLGYTSRVLAHDGREVTLSANARIIRDAEGRVVGSTGISRDITDQHLAREALRASEERFRLLSKATSDAIWDWDLVTHALWWNEGFETLFGFTRAEVEPTIDAWYNRIHPDDKDGVVAGVHAAIAAGDDAWTGDYRFMRKDGSDIHVHDTGHIIRDQDGKPIRMIGGMTDVTDRRRMERHFL